MTPLGEPSYNEVDQSISRSVDQSISRSVDQSISRSVDQSISRSVDQSISRSVDQSISRSVDQSPLCPPHGRLSRTSPSDLLLTLALLLALAAPASATDTRITYPEGAATRVLTLPSPGHWQLTGPDAGRLRIHDGALRFAARPDFESPGDADADNRYQVTLSSPAATFAATIRVTDRDEPGRASIHPRRPAIGETLTVTLADPDGAAAAVTAWQSWQGPGAWQAIPGAEGPSYTTGPADAGRHLRAVITYADRHGPGRQAIAMPSHPVLGPMLSNLAAAAEHGGAAIHPPFDRRIRHYRLACAERDVVTVSFTAPPGTRVVVNGIQPQATISRTGTKAAAAVAATATSDARVTLSDTATGAATTYTVHCAPDELAAITTEPDPDHPLEVLLAVTAGPWAAVIDEHGVPRAHVRAEHGNAGFFLLPFGAGPDIRWAHAEEQPDGGRHWRVLDRNFEPLRTVATLAPLTTTGRHDFRLMEDGSALLMTYEPAVRDLRGLSFPDHEGNPFSAAEEMADSAIQLHGEDGTLHWSWSSWGRLPLEDCAQHWFPGDWAHVNSVEWTGQGILASFRGCSTILMLDPAAPQGEEILWRLGASNLAADDWATRALGPAPLRMVGDPEGEFCGQHAAQLLPQPPGLALPRLLLFDNGVACVTDPHSGEPLGRQPEIYSRAVEYALDLEHGEAIFLRHHSPGGARDSLGYAGGHVAPLPDGDWLVSWGTGRTDNPPPDALTRVDPETGTESFRIPALESRSPRALPVSPLALLHAPPRLAAVLPDKPPEGHRGPGDRIEITLAFNRPVAPFGAGTGTVTVTGGKLLAAAPLTGFGRPAHAWSLLLAPSGEGRLVLGFRAGLACTGPDAGICTAGGARLDEVPPTLVIGRLAAPPEQVAAAGAAE